MQRSAAPFTDEAAEDMFEETSTKDAPWVVIGADHKWHARVRVCEAVLDVLQ